MVRFFTVLIVCLILPADAEGGHDVNSPYCGVYAIYATAKMYGRPADMTELLNSRYVSSYDGSTASDLIAAASSVGLEANLHTGMTRLDLLSAGTPLILHTRSSHDAPEFDHWTLVVDVGQSSVKIMGDDGTLRDESLSDLSTRWSGAAVTVSDTRQSGLMRLPFYSLIGSFVFALALMSFQASRSKLPPVFAWAGRSPARAALCLALIAVLATAVQSAVDGASVLRNSTARNAVVSRNIGKFLPTYSASQVQAFVVKRRGYVVDARAPADYAAAHIPTAISIPHRTSPEGILAALPGLRHAPQRKVVIYCQTNRCTFSDDLARTIIGMGHNDVAIFRNGWQGWVDAGLEGAR